MASATVGSPSPLLANIYLHYVFDLWVQRWRTKRASGDVVIVRYADDFIVGFENYSEAKAFLSELKGRFAEFGLELHPEKTRLIEFGRYAATAATRSLLKEMCRSMTFVIHGSRKFHLALYSKCEGPAAASEPD